MTSCKRGSTAGVPSQTTTPNHLQALVASVSSSHGDQVSRELAGLSVSVSDRGCKTCRDSLPLCDWGS